MVSPHRQGYQGPSKFLPSYALKGQQLLGSLNVSEHSQVYKSNKSVCVIDTAIQNLRCLRLNRYGYLHLWLGSLQ